ncbi:hypothetical protein AKJ16_DCAP20823 [Drosera capensis]
MIPSPSVMVFQTPDGIGPLGEFGARLSCIHVEEDASFVPETASKVVYCFWFKIEFSGFDSRAPCVHVVKDVGFVRDSV